MRLLCLLCRASGRWQRRLRSSNAGLRLNHRRALLRHRPCLCRSRSRSRRAGQGPGPAGTSSGARPIEECWKEFLWRAPENFLSVAQRHHPLVHRRAYRLASTASLWRLWHGTRLERSSSVRSCIPPCHKYAISTPHSGARHAETVVHQQAAVLLRCRTTLSSLLRTSSFASRPERWLSSS